MGSCWSPRLLLFCNRPKLLFCPPLFCWVCVSPVRSVCFFYIYHTVATTEKSLGCINDFLIISALSVMACSLKINAKKCSVQPAMNWNFGREWNLGTVLFSTDWSPCRRSARPWCLCSSCLCLPRCLGLPSTAPSFCLLFITAVLALPAVYLRLRWCSRWPNPPPRTF
jgi:hypothetical protein